MKRELRVAVNGSALGNGGPISKPGTGLQLESVGVSGAWLVSVWKRIVEYDGDKIVSCNGDQYTETETEFRNQQGELIATYFESFLSKRKPDPPAEK